MSSEEERSRSRVVNMSSSRRLPTMQDHLEALDQNLSRLQATNASQSPQSQSLIKPKDIQQLEIKRMNKTTSRQIVTRFLNAVESCAGTEEGRIDVAKHRLDDGAYPVVEEELRNFEVREGRKPKWDEFQNILYSLFTVKTETSRFIHELNTNYHYSIENDPREFVNKIRILYSSVDAYHRNELPNKDMTIKEKLSEGLSPSMERAMKLLMLDTNTSVDTFVKQLENLREVHCQRTQNEKRIRELAEVEPAKSTDTGGGMTAQTNDLLLNFSTTIAEQMRKGQEEVIRAIGKERPKQKYCGYCDKKDMHWSRYCPKNPPPGSCFDCWTVGHRRNDAVCPKKKE